MPPSPILASLVVSVGIHALALFYVSIYERSITFAAGRDSQVIEVKIRPATAEKAVEELKPGVAIQSGDEIFEKNEEVKNSRRGESVSGRAQTCPFPYDYLSAGSVDVRPVPRNQINRNPSKLIRYREGGIVDAELCIEIDGSVSRVIITRTTLPNPFERDVVDQFSKLHFSPAEKKGRVVPVRLKISVKYQQQSSDTVAEKIPLVDQ